MFDVVATYSRRRRELKFLVRHYVYRIVNTEGQVTFRANTGAATWTLITGAGSYVADVKKGKLN
jgi:hypothetical protein